MKVSSAHVRDFQSIKDAKVSFGSFTVLVGRSSSGKSAFLRALRACLRNTIVPANVRQGSAKAVIDVEFDDGPTVRIERGKSLSTYRLINGETEETFTKSGRTVPDGVAKIARVPLIADTDVTFSFQFDRPFLLAETGSQAAQVIGSLTNVSLLHAAVREANRRRGEASSTLRVRKVDVESYRGRIKEFADLPARKKQVIAAEEQLAELSQLEESLRSLRRTVGEIAKASTALAELEAVEPPDVSKLLEEVVILNAVLKKVELARSSAQSLKRSIQEQAGTVRSLKEQIAVMEIEYDEHLRAAGKCPVCGADTSDLTHRN